MRFLIALLAVIALAFAGCGGDDGLYGGGDETTATPAAPAASDENAVREALEGALVADDPKLACDRFVTDAYLQDNYGDRTACIQSLGSGSRARSVDVSKINVQGDAASAVAVPSGGPTSGDRLMATLIREGEEWKVDSLRSNAPVGP
jgi:hypothetical protein